MATLLRRRVFTLGLVILMMAVVVTVLHFRVRFMTVEYPTDSEPQSSRLAHDDSTRPSPSSPQIQTSNQSFNTAAVVQQPSLITTPSPRLPTGTPPLEDTTPDADKVWWMPPRMISHYGIKDWTKPTGNSWTSGFCKDFLVNTFDKTSQVCTLNDRITCHGTHLNTQIGTCTLLGLAVKPAGLKDAFANRNLQGNDVAWLTKSNSNDSDCSRHDLSGIRSYMEKPDPFRSLVNAIASANSPEACQVWVKGTSFFYMGVGDHIYFKMLGWYNLHRSLLRHSSNLTSFTIVRLPESKSHFHFAEFERTLFPQSFGLEDFKEEVVCFEKTVFVPWTYAATPFRCKMDGSTLKRQCMGCNGKGLETDLVSFRRRILSSCSLHDYEKDKMDKRKILVIQRKQYIRRVGDSHGKFQRVWTNSKELIDTLKSVFPHDEIIGMYGEDLPICQQIQLAHDADILIGMHGAGLVHLWWLMEDSISFELVPLSQAGNGAFTTLSTLLGRRHYQFHGVTERGAVVTVDIGRLIIDIKSKIKQ